MSEVPTKDLEVWSVLWEDAHFSALEYERSEIVHRSMKYITTGLMIEDNEKGITLATDVCETGSFRQTNFVPRAMIVDKWKIGALTQKKKRTKKAPPPDVAPINPV